MIKNYLTTAFRIMLRQKSYSAINIIGLSLGIAASLLIILYVVDEVSYDKFHRDADRAYRLSFAGRLEGNDFKGATSPAPVAPAIQAEIPEIEETVRFGLWRTMPISFEDKAFTEKYFLVADSNFFKFFSFPVIHGDPSTALKGVDKVAITQSAAKRYFGDENPIGKILLRGSEKKATEVTAVIADAPTNSHIPFDMILSGQSWNYMKDANWTSNNLYTYFRIHPQADINKVKKQIDAMSEKNMGAELEKFLGMTFKEFRAKGNDLGLKTQPMLDIHLRSELSEEMLPGGNIQYVYIFVVIAAFIILIACINFMNLATARSANRAKEVGVRKTIGAFRSRLVAQFIAESMIYSFISTILALAIMAILIVPFNELSGKSLTFDLFLNPFFIVGIIAFTFLIGLIAGSYPAFYLTSFKPVDVLKGKVRAGFKNSTLRNTLVVAQFTISIALIIGSLVVYKQLTYMQEKDLGFKKQNVIQLLHTWSLEKNAKAFKNELAQHPEFTAASYTNATPPNINWTNAFRKGGSEQDYLLSVYLADHDQLNVMGFEIVEGRFFSRDFKSDTAAVVLNETAYKLMGFTKMEGSTVINYGGDQARPMHIIGIVKDFNFETLRNDVKPLVFILSGEPNGSIAIRLAEGNPVEQLKLLESIWRKHSSDPFEYSFIDENYDALFRGEQRMSRIILIFTILTIAIACLGLFGLATYVAEQRAKEISIRKVMGASVPQMLILLSKDFAVLISIAFVIAAPVGWYFMNSWLEGFAYRVGIDVSVIIIAGIAAMGIALITISFQSIKAARENPVNALKME
jgi:putative ABC transport system permease protein